MKPSDCLLPAVVGQLLFVSCQTVRKDDHSYTYVYQHNVQTQAPAQGGQRVPAVFPSDRRSQALEAEFEVSDVEVPAPGYSSSPIGRSSPVEDAAYVPPRQQVFHDPPQSVYYRTPPVQDLRYSRSVYSPPIGLVSYPRRGNIGWGGGECRRPVSAVGGGGYYSIPSPLGSVCGKYPRGR
jgi:hypothetical protein